MTYFFYRLMTTIGGPLISLYLARRKAQGKEDTDRFDERRGIAAIPRPAGHLIWVHGASVGESMSLLPVVEKILEEHPQFKVMMTTGTITSARLMARRLPGAAFHQYIPVDRPAWVRRFVDHWHPDLILWAESEFWPNLLHECAGRGIPMVLINGRMSSGSFRTWQRFPGLIKSILSGFTLCLGQTKEDAGRLSHLGASDVGCVGNLKFAAPDLPVADHDLKSLSAMVSARPLWLAASTYDGEEIIAARVHQRLSTRYPELLTIIVPRQPQRGDEIASQLTGMGLCVARRSAGDMISPKIDIYLADTLGELGLFYRLANVVFMGKSLTGRGGQNPLEPARLECAIVFGPHMSNFDDIARRLVESKGARIANDENHLAATIDDLLGNQDAVRQMAGAAMTFARAEANVLDAVMDKITPYFPTNGDTPNARA